ncbi:MAG: hypothetical protein FWF82_06360, partial [Oscillospiraceae bacterium]|nr:hypothetical protein [Oscillospiraceae bacterium]
SAFPELSDSYRQLTEDFKRAKLGVFDDFSDLDRAVAVSDAYYGDGGSVFALYSLLGKPIMRQNSDLNDYDNAKVGDILTFACFKVKDDVLWGVSLAINGLFSVDLNTHDLKFCGGIPGGGIFEANQYSSLTVTDDFVVLVPSDGRAIAKYDIKKEEFVMTPIASDKGETANKFNASYEYGGTVYALPCDCHFLMKYDTKTDKVVRDRDICADSRPYFFKGGVIVGDSLMIASSCTNTVVKYDLKSGSHDLYKVGDSCNRYLDMVFDGANYWLFGLDGVIVKWNEDSGTVERVGGFPEGFTHDSVLRADFACAVVFGKSVFVFPMKSNMLLKIDTDTGEIESFAKFDNSDDRPAHSHYKAGGDKYCHAEKYGEYIYAASSYERSLQKINPETGEINNISLTFSSGEYNKLISPDSCRQTAENEMFTLPSFLDFVRDFESESGSGSGELNEPCGARIYQLLKSEALGTK